MRHRADMMTEGRNGSHAKRGRLAQLVRAPALQAGCRGFKSLTAHHLTKQVIDSKRIHLKTNNLCKKLIVRRVRPVRLITPRTALLPYNTGRTLQRRFRGWDRDSGASRQRRAA
jgi:hypothetical protein